MIYCKNKNLGCLQSTIGEFDDGVCDKCWLVKNAVEKIQSEILEMNDSEPMDGDETETLSKVFLFEINQLNGNK